MREPDYQAHPALDRVLTLAHDAAPPTDASRAVAAWSVALARPRVLLVRSVARARALLLQAAGVEPGESVGVPANAGQSLVQALKAHAARPHFLELGPDLAPIADPSRLAGVRIAWTEGIGGLATIPALPGISLWVDHADSLPIPVGSLESRVPSPESNGSAFLTGDSPPATGESMTLWGLHLSDAPAESGALLAFDEPDLHAAVAALLTSEDCPDSARALAQCRRLVGDQDQPGLAVRQQHRLAETWRGLAEAAGLPLLPLDGASALAQHVAVRIPDEADVSTFYAYVAAENTPVRWLPLLRPLHHAAIGAIGVATAA
nr:hypothetical protein [Chloroflexota bacterium]